MPDFGSPVADKINIDPNQGIKTLSQVLDVRQKQQALQGQAAQVQQEQQTARQRQAIAGVDWSKYDDGTGIVSTDKMLGDKELQQRAGDQFLDIVKTGASIRGTQLQNKESLVGLNDKLRDQFGSVMGALRTDPDIVNDTPAGRAKVDAAISRFAEAGGPDAARVAKIYAPISQAAPQGKLERSIKAVQLQALDASKQAAAQQPSYTDTGATLKQTNPLAADAAQSGDLQKSIAPGRQPFTDAFGRVFNFNQQTGNYEPSSGGAASSTSKGTGPGASNPGDLEALRHQADQNFSNANSNRVAAGLAPQQLDQISKALQLSKTVDTGNWAVERSKIESGLSSIIPGFGKAQDDATKLQLLDKFSERIAADSARVLGANASTDAARDSIHRQNANVGYTPEAVQSVLRYAKAQTLAMQAKGDAQETWLKQKGNGITNQHEFETQWRQSYDPVLFQLEAADPAEQANIVKGLSPEEAGSLAGKRSKLRQLGVSLP